MLTAVKQSLARLRKRANDVVQRRDAEQAAAGAADRIREVWPREEWKTIQRGFDLLGKRGIEVYLRCDAKECRPYVMTHHSTPDGKVLRCRHKDRVLSPR